MSAVLWTTAEAAAATRGRVLATGGNSWSATGVSIDSRTVSTGDLFVALQGPVFDGHDFAGKAFAAGAAAALIHRPVEPAGPALVVRDTRCGLEDLGRAARDRCNGRIVAVTGSVGKTGVKESLRTLLSRQGKTYATVGNLNNHWGAPLSLARLPRSAAYGVFELGMSNPGELAPLSRMVRPHVALITTVAPVHVEFFDSVEAVAEAKAEIFQGVVEDGAAVLPRDNDHFDLLDARAAEAGVARRVSFGVRPEADVRLLASVMDADGSDVTASAFGKRLGFRVGVPGHHWVINALGMLAAISEAGADVAAAAAAMTDLKAPAGRGARRTVRLPDGSFDLLDESYNASPAAMRAAFETLMLANPRGGGRRIAVLGDMRELGGDGPALHAGLADDLVDANIDLLFSAGPLMRHLYEAVPAARRGVHAAASEALIPSVAAAVQAGDVVCVKGSLGSRMKPVVDALIALENCCGEAGGDAV
ncbi:MAG: UDP-N-acetylmuramoylalanyl-D-glutamyl-2,6-diaminopimelate--D-alanyl-D-alanine ligase [Rhodospirillaceae bacterium]|nr:UDP-N-acetylmuramoylalanyl-D-glutamyl-2,6-diaminopimelate--D-alanyl-D-alanine ligase [Rhodospirillaceae bacterium]